MVLATTVGIGKASAQQPKVVLSDAAGWHKIGSTTVDFQEESDEVVIIGANRFASIKFKITGAPVEIESIVAFYESGDSQEISVKSKYDAGKESKEFELNGGERNLKKIVFVYNTPPNNSDVKATIEIWGFKTNADTKTDTNKK